MSSRKLLLAALLGIGLVILAGQPTPADDADAARIQKLIDQLGSGRFAERTRAAKELDTIGVPALEALRKAAESPDAELRRRAEDLVRKIESRSRTAQALTPTRVHLSFKDTPLSAAVAEFARKSGCVLTLHDPDNKLKDRPITLDTGETTFWHAFDLFCRKAELVEVRPQEMMGQPPMVAPPPIPKDKAAPGQPPPAGAANPAPGGPLPMRMMRPRMAMPVPGQITLKAGRPENLPSDDTSAVCVRAVKVVAGTGPRAASEVDVVLEIAVEPKLQWQNLSGVRLTRAVDDQGAELAPVQESAVNPAAATPSPYPTVFYLRQYPCTPLPIQLGAKKASVLKELRGTISAQIRTEARPLLTVENILQASGKTVKAPAGGSLKIRDIVKGNDGKVTIRYELQIPPNTIAGGNPMVAVPPAAMNKKVPPTPKPADSSKPGKHPAAPAAQPPVDKAVPPAKGEAKKPGQPPAVKAMGPERRVLQGFSMGLTLYDAAGKILPTETAVTFPQNPQVSAAEYEMVYQPQKGQGEPVKLVFFGRSVVALDIPFTLKNVTLP
jgi:hypothetical protein